MASQREQQQEETHFRVMRLLDEDPSISTRRLPVGWEFLMGYYYVTALVEKGFVKLKILRDPKQQLHLRTHAPWYSRQGGANGFIS